MKNQIINISSVSFSRNTRTKSAYSEDAPIRPYVMNLSVRRHNSNENDDPYHRRLFSRDCENPERNKQNNVFVKALDLYVTLNTWATSDSTLESLGAPGCYTTDWSSDIEYTSLPEQIVPEEGEQIEKSKLQARAAAAAVHVNLDKELPSDEEMLKAFSDKAEAKKLVKKFVSAA